jgi:hypothetical protein
MAKIFSLDSFPHLASLLCHRHALCSAAAARWQAAVPHAGAAGPGTFPPRAAGAVHHESRRARRGRRQVEPSRRPPFSSSVTPHRCRPPTVDLRSSRHIDEHRPAATHLYDTFDSFPDRRHDLAPPFPFRNLPPRAPHRHRPSPVYLGPCNHLNKLCMGPLVLYKPQAADDYHSSSPSPDFPLRLSVLPGRESYGEPLPSPRPKRSTPCRRHAIAVVSRRPRRRQPPESASRCCPRSHGHPPLFLLWAAIPG